MNLNQLAKAISKISSEKVVQDLSGLLIEWKGNGETANELKDKIERYYGNTWIEKNDDYKKIYQLWSLFRDEAIAGVGGMP